LRNELERVLQQIGDDALQLRRIEGKQGKLVVGQKVKRQTFFLKSQRPQPANIGQALVDVADGELHVQAAGLERAVGQEILNESLQPFPARLHVQQDLALAGIQRSQLLALEQFNVSIHDGQRSLQVVSRRCQGIRGALEASPQLRVRLQKIRRVFNLLPGDQSGASLCFCLTRLRSTH